MGTGFGERRCTGERENVSRLGAERPCLPLASRRLYFILYPKGPELQSRQAAEISSSFFYHLLLLLLLLFVGRAPVLLLLLQSMIVCRQLLLLFLVANPLHNTHLL